MQTPFKIGIADDETCIHESLTGVLTRKMPAASVQHFYSTSQLKKYLRQGPSALSVLLLDVHFPGDESGVDALPVIRQYSPGLLIFLLTAEKSSDFLSFAYPYDIEYLPKPISEDAFIVSVQSAIHRHAKQQALIEELLVSRSTLKDLQPVSNLKMVLEYTRYIETYLERRFNAYGKGLTEKLQSISDIPLSLQQSIKAIASTRNKLVHEDGYDLEDINSFRFLCQRTVDDLNRVRGR
jgi:DNA-binding LytR/AlgR family response regulator